MRRPIKPSDHLLSNLKDTLNTTSAFGARSSDDTKEAIATASFAFSGE